MCHVRPIAVGGASSYRLHAQREADEELLGDLMSRYCIRIILMEELDRAG